MVEFRHQASSTENLGSRARRHRIGGRARRDAAAASGVPSVLASGLPGALGADRGDKASRDCASTCKTPPDAFRNRKSKEAHMAVLFGDPFDTLFHFQQALDALRSSDWLGTSPSGGGSYPPLNIFRKGDDIIVLTEVPGIAKDDLQIQVKGKTIRIAGKKAIKYGDNVGIHRRERLAGSFDRAISVPVEIDADRVKAECRDGILALFLPRAEKDKPRPIKIA
jgi:HSP20 family protein